MQPEIQEALLVLLRFGYTIRFDADDGTFHLQHNGGPVPLEALWAIQTLQQNRRLFLDWLTHAPTPAATRFATALPLADAPDAELAQIARLGPITRSECQLAPGDLEAAAKWWAWNLRTRTPRDGRAREH